MSIIYRHFFLIFCLSFLLSACGIKPAAGGRSSKLFETFYTGTTGGTQYFIKPLTFKGPEDEVLFLDVTFRDGAFRTDSARLNYTFITKGQLSDDKRLAAQAENGELYFETDRVSRLFQEKDQDMIRTRFTGSAANRATITALIGRPVFTLETAGTELIFRPTPKTTRKLEALRKELFSLYEKEL
jgi:hypothetical protein